MPDGRLRNSAQQMKISDDRGRPLIPSQSQSEKLNIKLHESRQPAGPAKRLKADEKPEDGKNYKGRNNSTQGKLEAKPKLAVDQVWPELWARGSAALHSPKFCECTVVLKHLLNSCLALGANDVAIDAGKCSEEQIVI